MPYNTPKARRAWGYTPPTFSFLTEITSGAFSDILLTTEVRKDSMLELLTLDMISILLILLSADYYITRQPFCSFACKVEIFIKIFLHSHFPSTQSTT